MKRPDRLAVGRVAATWWLPTVIACAVGALYVCYSVAQWRALVVPSWDLGIFAEAVQAYSRFEAPIVPIKGPGYNLLGDHFHPILALLGPVYRLFPSALTLLVVQDVLIAVSVLPVARLAQRLFGRGGAVIVGLGYGLGWGLQGAVGAQFHEVCVAVPLLAFGGVAFVEHRWGACMGWLAPLVLVKEDLGLTVFMAGLAIAWRGRGEGRPAVLRGLAYALFGIVAFVVTVKVLLPAMNPAGTWAYSLDGAATGAGTPMDGSTAARGLPSLWDILTTPSVKLATLLVLLAGAGFVGSASPWFALVLPTLAWRFAGSVESYYVWDSWHYNAVLVPIAACSLLDVINRWCEPERAAPAVSVHAPVDGSGLEETGDTFVKNALIKARAVAMVCDYPILADDSGICVEALGGAPGVRSARYAGDNATDEDRINKLLTELGDNENRRAKFVTSVAFIMPDGTEITAEGEVKGTITKEPKGENGFGYDPIFLSDELGKTFAESSDEEKNSISHRGRALKNLYDKLKKMN